MKKQPATRHLTPRQLRAVQQRMDEIRRQRYLLECMQAELERYVADETGIDLRHGHWSLELEQGVVRFLGRVEASHDTP